MQPGPYMMQCPKCAQPVASDALMCPRCGQPFASPYSPPPQAMTPYPHMVTPAQMQQANSKKILAGILGIVLGSLGIHKFVLGYTTAGLIMLLGSLVAGYATCGISAAVFGVIGLVEGIIYLTKRDDEFYVHYMANRHEWF